MSDLIDKQAVIDALYDWREHSMTDAEAWHLKQVIGDIKSLKEDDMNKEKWHDLRKNPNDLPKERDEYWVMIDGCPHVESDSFDPSAIGKDITSPICKNGEIVGYETYPQSGWWENSKPGWVTHWMVMEKPPMPEPPSEVINE